MDAVRAESVSYTYPDGTKAISSVNFHVKEGTFAGIIASNGSGKTTLLRVLAGMLKATSGKVEIFGKPVGAIPERELFRMAGMVFQNPADQLFAATLGEDIAFGPTNMGLSKDEVKERVEKALSDVGLAGLGKRPVQALSFGQQKRACIAGLLAMGQKLLFLDEPTAGLDPAGERKVVELLTALNRERGITMVMATHNVDMVPLFADRLTVLSDGKVVGDGSPEAVFRASDEMAGISLRLPQAAELIERMRVDGVGFEKLPLTIGEAQREIMKRMPGRG